MGTQVSLTPKSRILPLLPGGKRFKQNAPVTGDTREKPHSWEEDSRGKKPPTQLCREDSRVTLQVEILKQIH